MASTDDDQAHPLDVAVVEAATAWLRIGHPLVYFSAIGSTNSEAMTRAQQGAAEGTLITTDDQTAGRGRMGRAWVALPNEQLAFSLILRLSFPPHFLVMASALAVAEAIEAATGMRPAIKWPNDVLLDGRKVCGILIETSGATAVLGIGINVNGTLADHPELAARAMTLADSVGHPVAREPLLIDLLVRLDGLYGALNTGGEQTQRQIRAAWRERLMTLGQRVTIQQGEQPVSGLAADVDAMGALEIVTDDGARQTITWGDVE